MEGRKISSEIYKSASGAWLLERKSFQTEGGYRKLELIGPEIHPSALSYFFFFLKEKKIKKIDLMFS